jgi:hypothetical protein
MVAKPTSAEPCVLRRRRQYVVRLKREQLLSTDQIRVLLKDRLDEQVTPLVPAVDAIILVGLTNVNGHDGQRGHARTSALDICGLECRRRT